MNEKTNFRKKLEAGEIVLGLNVIYGKSLDISFILKDSGIDWILFDNEITPLNTSAAHDAFMAANRVDLMTFVRVRENEQMEITAQLSNGALGVFIPDVRTANDAKKAVKSSYFYPKGERAVPGYFPQIGFKVNNIKRTTDKINSLTTVVCMIESWEGIENIEEISKVNDIDILLVGASDLSYDLGIAGQYDNPLLLKSIKKVIEVAKENGKYSGIAGIRNDELIMNFIEEGAQLIMMENDISLFYSKICERVEFFNNIGN